MRKIERAMITAVANGRDWRSGNTSVDITDNGIVVRLHGNKIAQIDRGMMFVTPAGWTTSTTKSRLNALLSQFTDGASIYQKDFEWFFNANGETREMFSDSTLAVNVN